MDTKSLIDELIKVQSSLIVNCYKIIKDIEFLSSTEHPKGIADVIAGDQFFIRSGNYMWTILVLELNKLFDNREDYALNKTLNIAINNHSKVKWVLDGDLVKLQEIKKEIEDEEIQSIVRNFNHIRNKQIAHLDKNRLSLEVLIYLSKTRRLVDLGQKTLSEIHWKLNGTELLLDLDLLGLCEMTIANLVEYNKIRN